ncbi:exonuclease domain-containing protein [Dolosicoccus paucivorans]|uniref:exonuclease domain-containing protein n=1 Tax=Dolosicoccus paucivorans TaxID=84521 RepID=UPI0008911233|nr:exonuclease domain-containing protein [Dolosicoccus paucivorans]SDI48436.1 exonuclease, DNA polymerase III, epsilon subunit family [Dolosicoccus paucivorans]
MIEKVAVIDLETTGPRYEDGDCIIQIGVVLLDNGQVVQTYETKVNPQRLIPHNISQLTGIYDKDVEDVPYIEQVIEEVYHLIKDRYLVAHNAPFDYSFLFHTFQQQLQIDFYPIGIIDTVSLAKIFFPQAPAFNLTALSKYLNLSSLKAHDALADALVTGELLQCIIEKVKTFSSSIRKDITPILKELNSVYLQLLDQPFEEKNKDDEESNHTTFTLENDIPFDTLEELERLTVQREWVHLWPTNPQASYLFQLQLIQHFISNNRPMIVGVHNEKELDYVLSHLSSSDWVKLYSKESYFDEKRYYTFLNKFNTYRLKDKQLVALAANRIWLEETTTGYIHEIHHELNIYPLLTKHTKAASKPSKFFLQALEKASLSPGILIQYKHLDILKKESFRHRFCFVLDSVQYYLDQVESRQKELSFEDDRDKLRRLYHDIVDQKPPTSEPLKKILQQIQRVEKEYDQVSFELKQLLKEYHQPNDEPQEQIKIYLTSQTIRNFEWKSRLDSLKAQLKKLRLVTEQWQAPFYLYDSLLELTRFTQRNQRRLWYSVSDSWLITGERLFEQYLHPKLIIKPVELPENHPLSYFDQVMTWSTEPFKDLQGYYEDLVMMDYSVAFKHQEDPFKAKTKWIVPMEYLQIEKTAESGQERVIESQMNYLLDQAPTKKSQRYLIITNHLNQSIETTKAMQAHPKISKDYVVLGEGVSGSFNKILARTQNSHQSIMVVTMETYLNEMVGSNAAYNGLLLQSLPFKPMHHETIQFTIETGLIEQWQAFDQVMIADMLETMYLFKKVTDTLPTIGSYLLFDQRLFIADYSDELIESLKNSYEFDFNTDISIDSWYTK